MKQSEYLAIDIGASSGRHIIGFIKDEKLCIREIYRFENGFHKKDGRLCWDIDRLKDEVIKGIRICKEKGYHPQTLGIDTWAVDYVYINRDGKRIGDVIAYRDGRTEGIRKKLEDKGILKFDEHYQRTGVQYQSFNTVYQLLSDKEIRPEILKEAECFLLIPDYLNYVLTGR